MTPPNSTTPPTPTRRRRTDLARCFLQVAWTAAERALAHTDSVPARRLIERAASDLLAARELVEPSRVA
jgi:hypothetical protein